MPREGRLWRVRGGYDNHLHQFGWIFRFWRIHLVQTRVGLLLSSPLFRQLLIWIPTLTVDKVYLTTSIFRTSARSLSLSSQIECYQETPKDYQFYHINQSCGQEILYSKVYKNIEWGLKLLNNPCLIFFTINNKFKSWSQLHQLNVFTNSIHMDMGPITFMPCLHWCHNVGRTFLLTRKEKNSTTNGISSNKITTSTYVI